MMILYSICFYIHFFVHVNSLDYNDDNDDVKTAKLLGPKYPPYGDNPEKDYKRICIFPNWSILRESSVARILPEDLDPNLCTHIHYAYANIDVKNLQLTPSQFQDFNHGEHGAPFYERIMKLKQVNPNLKVLISIGGWFAKSTPFNRILMTDFTRRQFIENALNFVRHWKFDGLDIHWEYPGALELGATEDSKEKFTSFMRYMSRTFKDEFRKNYKKFILTAFVPSHEKRIDDGYDVELICKFVEYAAVSTYDYTGPSDSKTGYNSPLYSRAGDSNSINASIHAWLDRGCPANKLLVGIPTYARGFKVTRKAHSPNMLHLGVESEPFLNPSLYTSEEGILSYYEVCELMSNKETKVYWDDVAMVPFAITINDAAKNTPQNPSSSIWISYEDARSARKKAEYVKQMSLGGVAIWSLDMDDFKGLFCNLGPYPIIDSIKQELDRTILVNPEENTEYTAMTTVEGGEYPPEGETTKRILTSSGKSDKATNSYKNDELRTTARDLVESTRPVFTTTKISNIKTNNSYDNSKKKYHAVKRIKIIASKRHTSNTSGGTHQNLCVSVILVILAGLLKSF